jgi:hypothetical protein
MLELRVPGVKGWGLWRIVQCKELNSDFCYSDYLLVGTE